MKYLRSFTSLILIGLCFSNLLVQFKNKEAEFDHLENKIADFIDTWSLKDKNFDDIILKGENDKEPLDIYGFKFESESEKAFTWTSDIKDEVISIQGTSEQGYKLVFSFEYTITREDGEALTDSGFVTLTSKFMSLKKSYPINPEGDFDLEMAFYPTFEITEITLDKYNDEPTIPPYIKATLTTDKSTTLIQRIEEFVDEDVNSYFKNIYEDDIKLLPNGAHFPYSVSLKPDVRPIITPEGITNFFSCTYSNDLGPIDVSEDNISSFKDFKPEDGMIQLFIHKKFVFDMFSLSRKKTTTYLRQADFPLDINYLGRFYPKVYNFKPRTDPLYAALQILDTRYDGVKEEGHVLSLLIIVDQRDEDALLHFNLEHRVTWKMSKDDNGINFFLDDKSVKLTKMSLLDKDVGKVEIDDIFDIVDNTTQKLLSKESFTLFKKNEPFAKLINKIDSADVLESNGFILKRNGPKKEVTFLG
jgi:hypothetical protein